MNRKITVIVFALAVAMLATPLVGTVMAKEKVYAELQNAGADPLIPGRIWTTNGGIQQQKGASRTFYHILTIGDESYSLVSVNTINATMNLETGYFGVYDGVWYVPT